mmetsp:Transcript_5021/g.7453  ORF Transcript_5021/g.7453 Transcript_5021/m.7453 type:complete len:470 (+) Transcript_5021:2-1411(+)
MKHYLIIFAHKPLLNQFRIAELKSAIEAEEIKEIYYIPYYENKGNERVRKPIERETLIELYNDKYLVVQMKNDEEAKRMTERCSFIQSIQEIWGDAKDLESCIRHAKTYAKENRERLEKEKEEKQTFKINVNTFGTKLNKKKHFEILTNITTTQILKDVLGKVKLSKPEREFEMHMVFQLNDEQSKTQEENKQIKNAKRKNKYKVKEKTDDMVNEKMKYMLRAIFAKKIADGGREKLVTYSLKTRPYIGTTSMSAELSFLVVNEAKIRENDYVCDPFVGTGSILLAAQIYGAHVIGLDLDIRVLKGNGKNHYDNIKHYQINKNMDLLRGDLYQHKTCWRVGEIFDAIVSDPPYGVRESCSRIGRTEYLKVEEKYQENHIAARVPYDQEEMMADFFNFAAYTLKMGGRLVYWLPSPVQFHIPNDLPYHPSFSLIRVNFDQLTLTRGRRLITMEKTKPFVEAKAATYHNTI